MKSKLPILCQRALGLFNRAILEREEATRLVERVRSRRAHPAGSKYLQANLFESTT